MHKNGAKKPLLFCVLIVGSLMGEEVMMALLTSLLHEENYQSNNKTSCFTMCGHLRKL
jgi:hypothetical protein